MNSLEKIHFELLSFKNGLSKKISGKKRETSTLTHVFHILHGLELIVAESTFVSFLSNDYVKLKLSRDLNKTQAFLCDLHSFL